MKTAAQDTTLVNDILDNLADRPELESEELAQAGILVVFDKSHSSPRHQQLLKQITDEVFGEEEIEKGEV